MDRRSRGSSEASDVRDLICTEGVKWESINQSINQLTRDAPFPDPYR
jgi:hypothetical protein